MAVITIPKILQERLTDEGAEALVHILDKVEEQGELHTLRTAEDRFEKRLAIETADVKTEIEALRTELKTEIANLRAELKGDIADTRAELIKWMFIFWAGQVATITAILFAFFRK